MAASGSNDENSDLPTSSRAHIKSENPRTPVELVKEGISDTNQQDGANSVGGSAEEDEEYEDEDGDVELEVETDEEVDDEPKLKYQRLTSSLSALYRNGDASSCFFVGGDKIVSQS